ncbi:MAG TPA: DUF268 domain-containing protein [Pyrinomonadaceae bacterium]|nr:DUF268 domain-containing protein [Pyrinomonadaceae bacterium]
MHLLPRKVKSLLRVFGVDVSAFGIAIRNVRPLVGDYLEFRKQQKVSDQVFDSTKFYPCLADRFQSAGTASGHYFFQDLLVAQKIFKNCPEKHVDVGSRIDGFVTHVAAFREIEVFDVRPVVSKVPNVRFTRVDLMEEALIPDAYCDSISSLHAVEHFGLGRYGDAVHYEGHIIGLKNIYRMLKPGGKFYFSVPFGSQRIEFNSQRVFSMSYLMGMLGDRFAIDSFCYVNDEGALESDVELTPDTISNNLNCDYGCAIFELSKI